MKRRKANKYSEGIRLANPGGLQVDGDLCEQAWIAGMKRGAGNQTFREVKGHATDKDVENEISNIRDREGNDTSDKLADKGVEAIAGIGLVKLGKWLEARHKKYRTLMVSVHRKIAAVTLAEKEETKRDHTIQKNSPWIRSSQADHSGHGISG